MLDTSQGFERLYAEFTAPSSAIARRRARNPENWEMIRFLSAQVDAGQKMSPEAEANIRSWLQVVESKERWRQEIARQSFLTIEERVAELGASIEEFAARPGAVTASQRVEGGRLVQRTKLLFGMKNEFPKKDRELMLATLNRHQEALDGKLRVELRVEPTSENNPRMRALLDQRIARASKNLNRVRQVYKNGSPSERRDIRSVRDAAIRNMDSLLRVDGGKLNPEQTLLARATLEKLKTIKPPKVAPYAWVQVVPGGLPTMGRGHK